MSSGHLRVSVRGLGAWPRRYYFSEVAEEDPVGGGRHHDYIIGILEGERAEARVVGP